MISWSENRERSRSFSSSQLLENIKLVNGLLQMLANDEDLHDDLKLPQVQVALKHFTGMFFIIQSSISCNYIKMFLNR